MSRPVRRCAGCGRKAEKTAFIRVVRLPSGEVVFDPEKKYEGRSLYFCPDTKCFCVLSRRRAPEKLMKASLTEKVQEAIKSYLSEMES